MKGLDAGFRERPGHIADAEFDDLPVRMGLLEIGYPLGNFRKQIGCLQFQIMLIDLNHGKPPNLWCLRLTAPIA